LFADYALLRTLAGQVGPFAQRRVENLLEDLLMLAWETRSAPPEVNDPTMREAARLLRERACETFSMAEVSGAVGLRPVQFTRRFRAAHGVTPIEYLTRLRLENVRKLLIETDCTLDEIAERCGWSSGYYLSSVFKTAFGMAPGKFRRMHRV
jgi:transcriptional regulator GlxA family with amidase domain